MNPLIEVRKLISPSTQIFRGKIIRYEGDKALISTGNGVRVVGAGTDVFPRGHTVTVENGVIKSRDLIEPGLKIFQL